MQLPFVSRERLTEAQSRIRQLEDENRRLTEILIPSLRNEPKENQVVIGENTDLSTIEPIPGRPTIASIQAKANQAALKRAETPGAKSLAEEVHERDMNLRRKPGGK